MRWTETAAPPATALLAAAGLLLACTSETLRPVITPAAADERQITVTLDRCDCASCRLAVRDPDTGLLTYSELDPPLGLAVAAATCFSPLTAEVILECGVCPGASACMADATLAAGGQMAGQISCATLAQANASCAARQTFALDGTPEDPACEP